MNESAGADAPEGVARCDVCGVTSDLEGAFVDTAVSLFSPIQSYCPPCWTSLWRRKTRVRYIILLLGTLAGIGLAYLFPDHWIGWALINLALFDLSSLLVTLPHELGHAISALLLGARVFRVSIGFGRSVWERQVLGVPLEVHIIPIGGVTVSSFTSHRWYRTRHSLTVLAGPLVNVAILLGVYAFVGPEAFRFDGFLVRLAPWQALVAGNCLILLVNLAPLRYRTAWGDLSSDGSSLLRAPFLTREAIDQSIALSYVLEGLEARRRDDRALALEWYERGLTRFPDDPILRNAWLTGLVDQEDLERARRELLRFEQEEGLEPESRTIAWNNLAWTDLLSGRAELLDEADHFSQLAHARAGWIPAVLSTRGSVLVEKGELAAGHEMLEEAFSRSEENADKSIIASYLALSEAMRGDHEAAGRLLETARLLDPDCRLLDRMADRIAALAGDEGGSPAGDP